MNLFPSKLEAATRSCPTVTNALRLSYLGLGPVPIRRGLRKCGVRGAVRSLKLIAQPPRYAAAPAMPLTMRMIRFKSSSDRADPLGRQSPFLKMLSATPPFRAGQPEKTG